MMHEPEIQAIFVFKITGNEMFTMEELNQKLANINEKIEHSFASCNALQEDLNQKRANHNALIGAQLALKEMVEEAQKKLEVPAE